MAGQKIVWDATGERWYEYGLDHGVLYPQDATGTYPLGVAWNGLTAVTESPSGAEPTDLWADNIKYGSIRSAETFGGTIEAYQYPPEFSECDGSKEIRPGVYIGMQNRTPFGLSYRTMKGNDTASEGDDGYLLHLVYGATASPSEKSRSTVNDSPEATTMSWEFDTDPVVVPATDDGTTFKPTAHIVIDSTTADATELAALEKILYGKDPTGPEANDGVAPRLPLPAELFTIFTEE